MRVWLLSSSWSLAALMRSSVTGLWLQGEHPWAWRLHGSHSASLEPPSGLQQKCVFSHTSGWPWGWGCFPLWLVLRPLSLAESSSRNFRSGRKSLTKHFFLIHLTALPGVRGHLLSATTLCHSVHKQDSEGSCHRDFPTSPCVVVNTEGTRLDFYF